MRFLLLFIFTTITFSASAQWYRVDLKLQKKHERLPPIAQPKDHSLARLPVATIITKTKPHKIVLDRSEYILDAAEYFVIKKAQHNMRFHVYSDASYNFTELAHLYMQENKFIEAKWFLLQSNAIARQQNDYKLTIANLTDLAMVKANIGDYTLARQDLAEARSIATTKGFTSDLPEIERKMLILQQNKVWPQKPEQAQLPGSVNNTKIE